MERRDRVGFTAQDWCHRFCERYDAAAGSTLTELGLFYERHGKFMEYGQRSDPDNPEYTDKEWNRVMASFLGQLAGDMGLVQAQDPEGRPQLEWYLPGVPDRPTVVIRSVSEATSAILSQDLVELSLLGSDLTVLLMYPDYPLPEGASTFEGATRTWRAQIAQRLSELRPERETLALMISAYSFELPAPWQGFVWNPNSGALDVAD